jgi:hypothetical protein
MKEDKTISFKIADNRYVFYDAFIHKSGYICTIGPMYENWMKELGVHHDDVVCVVGDERLSGEVIRDPHGHTIITKFHSCTTLGAQSEVVFLVNEFTFHCVVSRSDDSPKFCVASTTLKNCSQFVENWFIYHMSIGIEHFYIYDNNSSDVAQLKNIMDKYPTTYIHWPFPYRIVGNSGISGQTCAQNISLYKYDHQFVAMTDIDEYIYSKNSSLLKELNGVDVQTHSGILMQCQWFGCSNGVSFDDDFLEKLVYKKNMVQKHAQGHGPKGIICPDSTTMYAVHRVTMGKPMVKIGHETIRFNHYYTLTASTYKNPTRNHTRKLKCDCNIYDVVFDNDIAIEWQKLKTKKYVFVSIPKNGSQSVFSMLGYKIKDRSSNTDIGIMDNHARCVILRDRYIDFDSRFSFCFVRNPWERLVSWYDHHLKTYKCEPYKSMSFKTWVLNDCPHHWKRQNGTDWNSQLSPIHQWQFIYDDKGSCMVHRIFRMELFDEHFTQVCRIIGVDSPPKMMHKNKTTGGSWILRYDAESLSCASNIVEKDARLFGYYPPQL